MHLQFPDSTPLDCLINKDDSLATRPDEIANVIYSTQQQSFHRQDSLCSDPTNHQSNCTCAICQYPWHIIYGFTLEKRTSSDFQLAHLFTYITYDTWLKSLPKGKILGPDRIPDVILKALPRSFHDMLCLLFQQCYQQNQYPKNCVT